MVGKELRLEEAAWTKVVTEAKKEGIVTLYDTQWAGFNVEPVFEAFRGKYGVKVQMISDRGSAFIERLKAEKRMGQMTGDVVVVPPGHAESMRLEGLLKDVSSLPVFKEQGVWYRDPFMLAPDKKYFMFARYFYGPVINTKLVKPEEAAKLKSWHSFLDPKWKNKLILYDPELALSSYYFLTNIKLGRLDMEFLRALGKQELIFARSAQEEADMLVRGEAPICLAAATHHMSGIVLKGASVQALDMKEGIWELGQIMGLVQDGPHPNASSVFANWVLSEEGQSLLARALLAPMVRKGVPEFVPQGARVDPQDAIVFTKELNELISRGFRDKSLVNILKPK